MFCRNCGAKNLDGSKFCSGCGAALDENPEPKQETVEVQRPVEVQPVVTVAKEQPTAAPRVVALPERKKTGYSWVIAVVAILIIAGACYIYMDNYGHKAYISYEVHSTHITEDVDVNLYFNDQVVTSWHDLEPDQSFHNTTYRVVHFSLFQDSYTLTVKAVSFGGGLGNQADSETIVVAPGGTYHVDLYV